MNDEFEYVRRYYGVPAERGMKIVVNGRPATVRAGAGHYLHVLFDGERSLSYIHPTWCVSYPVAA